MQLLRYASYTSEFEPKWLSETKHGSTIDLHAPSHKDRFVHVMVIIDDIDEWGIKTESLIP